MAELLEFIRACTDEPQRISNSNVRHDVAFDGGKAHRYLTWKGEANMAWDMFCERLTRGLAWPSPLLTPIEVHERWCSSHNIHPVFDLDGADALVGKNRRERFAFCSDVLLSLHGALKDVFRDHKFVRSVVWTASTESKLSLHVHFPWLIVPRDTLIDITKYVQQRMGNHGAFVDLQVPKTCSLRMPLCDKLDADRVIWCNRPLLPFSDVDGLKNVYDANGNALPNDPRILKRTDEGGRSLYRLVRASVVTAFTGAAIEKYNDGFAAWKKAQAAEAFRVLRADQPVREEVRLQWMDSHIFWDWREVQTRLNELCFQRSAGDEQVEEAIDYINQRAVIDDSGTTTVLLKMRDPQTDTIKLEPKARADFIQTLAKPLVALIDDEGENGKRKAKTQAFSLFWLQHERRNHVNSTVFMPRQLHEHAGSTYIDNYLNKWRGWRFWKLAPNLVYAGVDYSQLSARDIFDRCDSVQVILAHIYYNLANGDKRFAQFYINWLANIVQRPDDPPRRCIYLQGTEGEGKSILAEALIRTALGKDHCKVVSSVNQVLGTHNTDLEGCCFMVLEEATFGGDKQLAQQLQSLITAEMSHVNPKHQATRTTLNKINLLLHSNQKHLVHVNATARRYAFCQTADHASKLQGAALRTYLAPLVAATRDCIPFAMFLHKKDLASWLHTRHHERLNTELAQRQKLHSMQKLERWWLDCLTKGRWNVQWDNVTKQLVDGSARSEQFAAFVHWEEIFDNCKREVGRSDKFLKQFDFYDTLKKLIHGWATQEEFAELGWRPIGGQWNLGLIGEEYAAAVTERMRKIQALEGEAKEAYLREKHPLHENYDTTYWYVPPIEVCKLRMERHFSISFELLGTGAFTRRTRQLKDATFPVLARWEDLFDGEEPAYDDDVQGLLRRPEEESGSDEEVEEEQESEFISQ